MKIINMSNLNEVQFEQATEILINTLKISYPSFKNAMEKVTENLIPENTLLADV